MISEIVDVQISIEDTAVTRAGFGIGLIMGSSNRLTGKTQEFSSAAAAAEVYVAGDPELTMINQYFGQELKPEKVICAQRDADQKQKNKVTIPVLQNNTLYSITIGIDGGVGVQHDYTSDADATRAEIVDGLIAAINASAQATLLALTDNGDDFDIESNVAGDPLTITVSVNLSLQTLTSNRNIQSELALIEQSNDEWYCLLSASHLDKDIKRASEFIQARRKIYIASSQNADIISPEQHVVTLDFDADFVTSNLIDLTIDGIPVTQTPFNTDQPTTLNDLATNIQAHPNVATATVTGARQITITSALFDVLMVFTAIAVTGGASQANGAVTTTVDPTTDLGAELKATARDRTALMYLGAADTEFPEAAWAGLLLPEDPGSITWFGKTLAGVTRDELTSAEKNKALGNNVNTYTEIGGVNISQNGFMVSGRFLDVRRSADWLQARIEENIFRLIVASKKIPYTDAGVGLIENEIRAVLNEAIGNDVLRADPEPTVTVPKVLNVSANDRANRLLPDVTFEAQLAGAIHKVIVRGTVSV